MLISDLFKITVEDPKKTEALHQLKSQYDNAKKDIQERSKIKFLK